MLDCLDVLFSSSIGYVSARRTLDLTYTRCCCAQKGFLLLGKSDPYTQMTLSSKRNMVLK